MTFFRTTLTVAILLGAISLQAQQTTLTITGTAGKNETVTGATLELYHLPDSALVSTKVAGNQPVVFSVLPNQNYLLRSTAVGFQEQERDIAVKEKPVSVSLLYKKQVTALSGVTVVARRPLVKQEDDKTIVDADALAVTSSNAYEVLEKTPGAIVDQDGNVYLSSMTPATIQINGRDVKLSATDLTSLLKSLPAGSVSKIEILRNPSSKYDAASSGGIVNIVLKKGVKIGTSGSMNAAYFQGVYSTKTAGFNLNKGGNKASSYLSYQYTDRTNFENINSVRLVGNTSALKQTASTVYPSGNHYFGLGTDVSFTKKFNLAYDLRISANDSRSKAGNEVDIIDQATNQLIGQNFSEITNNNNSIYIGNNVSANLKLDSMGSEWRTQVDYNYFNYSNQQLYTNIYRQPAQASLLGNGDNNNRKNIFTLQSDLTLKIKGGYTLETGIKNTRSSSNNSAIYFYEKGSSGLLPDEFQTNQFTYKENITSAYVQLAKTFMGITFKPGVRLEQTDIQGRQILPKDTSLSIKRTDVFPFIYLRRRIAKLFGFELTGNAIFRRSITRPYYEVLNPYPKYVDQYLFDVGNPRLQPQFTNNYEFNISADDFTIFSVGVNQTKNIFGNVTYQDDATGIAYRTYDNLGKNKEVYLRFLGGIPPGGKYFFYMGGQQNINTYTGLYQNQPLKFKRSSWVFFMYHSLKIKPDLTASVNGFLRTGGVQNFYELNTFGGMVLSVNKSILQKKGNLILSLNDVFRTNRTTFVLQQGNVNASGNRYGDTRRLGLTFRYNFGIKPKEEKKPAFEQPAE